MLQLTTRSRKETVITQDDLLVVAKPDSQRDRKDENHTMGKQPCPVGVAVVGMGAGKGGGQDGGLSLKRWM